MTTMLFLTYSCYIRVRMTTMLFLMYSCYNSVRITTMLFLAYSCYINVRMTTMLILTYSCYINVRITTMLILTYSCYMNVQITTMLFLTAGASPVGDPDMVSLPTFRWEMFSFDNVGVLCHGKCFQKWIFLLKVYKSPYRYTVARIRVLETLMNRTEIMFFSRNCLQKADTVYI